MGTVTTFGERFNLTPEATVRRALPLALIIGPYTPRTWKAGARRQDEEMTPQIPRSGEDVLIDFGRNIRIAEEAASALISVRVPVICPHLNHFMMSGIAPAEFFHDAVQAYVIVSSCIVALPGYKKSEACEIQVALALSLGIRVFEWPTANMVRAGYPSCPLAPAARAIRDYLFGLHGDRIKASFMHQPMGNCAVPQTADSRGPGRHPLMGTAVDGDLEHEVFEGGVSIASAQGYTHEGNHAEPPIPC